ncbi:aminotransferase class III-fold pyridoxal phosphate-dependent enzyme [Erwinia amylovora]|uniref:aminotransferase class III-fold pyridoxal phosphate-dependent enzyme n=1 Tax=Erwinia amylovora TaxID=552 RepID=UPI0014444869|nr:aminotransferase class III-fold pyridoxal phosphate-dependent enzyme [Erwinia amylovora]
MQLSVTRQDDDQWIVPTCAPADLVPAKAGGSRLWQQQGKSSGDFADVIAGSGSVLAHLRRQQTRRQLAEKLRHTGNGCTIEPMLRLAKQRMTATFIDRVCFCHAAAEVSQAAVKLTCKAAPYPGPERINGIEAFHACTLFTATGGGQPANSKRFAPLPVGITHAANNDLTAAAPITPQTRPAIVEPVQGKGSESLVETAFLHGLRELCDRHEALLMFDKAPGGVGPTGSLYARKRYGHTPDVPTTAEAPGGGFPLAAMLTPEALAAHLNVGSHVTNDGVNAVAGAVGGKVSELVNCPEAFSGVSGRHRGFIVALQVMYPRLHMFSEMGGLGLLIGCVQRQNSGGKTKLIGHAAAREGLISVMAGADVVHFAPSIIISQRKVQKGLVCFKRARRAVAKGASV